MYARPSLTRSPRPQRPAAMTRPDGGWVGSGETPEPAEQSNAWNKTGSREAGSDREAERPRRGGRQHATRGWYLTTQAIRSSVRQTVGPSIRLVFLPSSLPFGHRPVVHRPSVHPRVLPSPVRPLVHPVRASEKNGAGRARIANVVTCQPRANL